MMTGYNGEYVPKTAGNLLFVCEMEAPQLLYFGRQALFFTAKNHAQWLAEVFLPM